LLLNESCCSPQTPLLLTTLANFCLYSVKSLKYCSNSWCYNSKLLELDYKVTLYWVTQENLIKSSLQNSLPYILLQRVCASYCAPYPKWLCVKHKANMWCPYCITSFCSRTFYFLLLNSMINIVTTPLDVTDVTVWQITSNPNPRVLKIEKWKITWKKNKMRKKMKKKLSLYSLILILGSFIPSIYL